MAAQTYNVFWKAATKECLVVTDATVAGFTKIGTHKHDDATDPEGADPKSHVLYQHARDALNLLGKPTKAGDGWDWNKAVTNMQQVKISLSAPPAAP